ncbi:MAG: recombinase A [Acidobacteria bacterium]|nr:recombinase A [Acidobacteriota bacterium]
MAAVAQPRVAQRHASGRLALPQPGTFAGAGLPSPDATRRTWTLATLVGRLTELSSPGSTAALSLAFSVVLDAQRAGEPVAWLSDESSTFFPPDVANSGIDLDALVVVRLAMVSQLPRAAEHLVRSGAFGLLVLDLGEAAQVPAPMQMRLQGLAQKHDAAILFLTRKQREAPSLGALISLRAEARREPRAGPDQQTPDARDAGVSTFTCTAQMLKDKRCGPGWTHVEVCRGPDGLC